MKNMLTKIIARNEEFIKKNKITKLTLSALIFSANHDLIN